MTAVRERALWRLREFEDAHPEAAALACYASLATRVDSTLLRRLRLDLVRRASASAEADLWFSDLSESRDGEALVFDPDVAAVLRERLARQSLSDGRPALGVAFEHTRAVTPRLAGITAPRGGARLRGATRPRGSSRRDRAASSTGNRRDGRQRATRPRDVALGPARDAAHAGNRARHRRCRRDDPGRHRPYRIRRRGARGTRDPAASRRSVLDVAALRAGSSHGARLRRARQRRDLSGADRRGIGVGHRGAEDTADCSRIAVDGPRGVRHPYRRR